MAGFSSRALLRRAWIAICTGVVLFAAQSSVAADEETVHRDRYLLEQVSRGARTVPVLARLELQAARDLAGRGDKEAAERHLREAVRLDPHYARAHFELARLNIGRLDPGGLVDLAQGVLSLTATFRAQAVTAVNGASWLSRVWLLTNLVICLAFSIKYLPYVAHKLTERLRTRHHAAFPRAASYLLLLSPALFFVDSIVSVAYLVTLCWFFMYRREKIAVIVLVAPFVAAGITDIHIRTAAVLTNPKSFTSLVDRANNAAAEENLLQHLEQSSPPGLEVEKQLALGLLHFKGRRYYDASDYLFQAVSRDPQRTMGYINLGNVHFMQGDYEKALQGYRKAEGLDPLDPICQYNLAQAYIKTLLMKEASQSLQAAASGVERERTGYAEASFDKMLVLPKLFSNQETWKIALAEGKSLDEGELARGRVFFPWLPGRAGALIVIGALVFVIILSRFIDPSTLTFQCSNCGKLTCNNCCDSEREITLCQECAGSIETVTSEKVVDALLRQRRQSVLVRRKKAARVATMLLPGTRDLYYGHVSRGIALSALFAVSIVCALTGGSLTTDPMVLDDGLSLWRLIASALGIAAAYALSAGAKPTTSFKPQHRRSGARRGETMETGRSSNAA